MLLSECLHHTPRRTLLAIGRANGFACASRASKSTLETLLATALARRYRPAQLAQLPAQELEALHFLDHRRGQTPLTQLEQRFGAIRPYRPWRRDEPAHPWRTPLTAAESLYFRGLVYLVRTVPRGPVFAILPEEFFTQPFHPLPRPAARAAVSSALVPNEPATALDITLLLVYLQQIDLHPLHGRWLTVRHCRELATCLAPPPPDSALRSEREALRLAFAHYLAERLNLLSLTGGFLKPSPAVDAWIRQDRATLLAGLWSAWLAPSDENRALWRRYRLPGHSLRDPVGFAQRLTDSLVDRGAWRETEANQAQSAELLPWWEHEQHAATPQALAVQLLAGPLSWLGVVSIQREAPGVLSSWVLTDLGAWLLGNRWQDPPLAVEDPLLADDGLSLALPMGVHCSLPAVLGLADWCDLTPGPYLRITQGSLARALARGNELPNLFALWQRWATPPLDDRQRALIHAWADSVRFLELRPTLLLQSASSEIMASLWYDRALRRHLGARLTGDLVTVRTGEPGRLANALRARGFTLRAHQTPPAAHADQAAAPAQKSAGESWWLYSAGLIHRRLAARLGLVAPPGAALAAIQTALGPAELAAAEAAAEALLTALRETLEEPTPIARSLEVAEVERRLLTILEAGETVQLDYWSPWYGERSVRCVRPLRIEWRGDHRYLAAYCLTANAERTFRLDRILDLTQCETA